VVERLALAIAILAPFYLRRAGAQQFPVDRVANKVIQKYQQSSCEQLY
jgi:hypothetical protein